MVNWPINKNAKRLRPVQHAGMQIAYIKNYRFAASVDNWSNRSISRARRQLNLLQFSPHSSEWLNSQSIDLVWMAESVCLRRILFSFFLFAASRFLWFLFIVNLIVVKSHLEVCACARTSAKLNIYILFFFCDSKQTQEREKHCKNAKRKKLCTDAFIVWIVELLILCCIWLSLILPAIRSGLFSNTLSYVTHLYTPKSQVPSAKTQCKSNKTYI